jgi:hypothetical protein
MPVIWFLHATRNANPRDVLGRKLFSLNRSDSATAIAVPVKNYAGQVVAAINVSAPDTSMGEEKRLSAKALPHSSNEE